MCSVFANGINSYLHAANGKKELVDGTFDHSVHRILASAIFLIKLTHQRGSMRNCFDLFPRFCVLELFLRKESVIETITSHHVFHQTSS